MKILLIHNQYTSKSVSGENIVFNQEYKDLQAKLGKENVLKYEVSNDNAKKLEVLLSILFSKIHYKNVKKIIEENNIDIVHIHNFYPMLTPSIFQAAKKSGAKVVHTLHNYRLWCLSGILYRNDIGICELCVSKKFSLFSIKNRCYRNSLVQSAVAQFSFWYYNITKVFDNIDYYFVLTDFQKKKVEAFGLDSKKIFLKPNGIGKIKNNNVEKIGYIFVGRLEASKGIIKLLDIWMSLDLKYVLTVIGTGELEIFLKEKYKKNNIIFVGKCSKERTLESISKSKYLVQPSLLYETFGLTILEAMSCGTPVIGFNIGTRKDFIIDKVNGFLADEINLKEVLIKSLVTKDYEMLSASALKTAKKFELDYIINKQVDIYHSILESNKNEK